MEPSPLFKALKAYAANQSWQYIYPVWSRRAQGLSIGINLHPNHSCNWHCLYCQVPGLQRGSSPTIDTFKLMNELTACLDWLSAHCAPLAMQECVEDIAFAGDGEPTTSPQFTEIMHNLIQLLQQRPLHDRPTIVRVITNGSQIQHAHVQHALKRLNEIGGEVWFKLDASTDAEMHAINDTHLPLLLHLQRLQTCCKLCITWVQTAVVSRVTDGNLVTTPNLPGYKQALQTVKEHISGILLYGIARPSQQDHMGCIKPTSSDILMKYAEEVRTLGICVRVFE